MRHLRQAWDNGTLSITADLAQDVPSPWVVVFCGFWIALLAACLVWQTRLAWGFWRQDWFSAMAPEYQGLSWIVAEGSIIVLGALCILLQLGFYWPTLKANAVLIQVRNDRFLARLKNGTEVEGNWSQLEKLDTVFNSIRLKFRERPVVCLPPPGWSASLRPLFRIAKEKSLGIPTPDDTDGISRRAIIRIGFYCLAASIVGAWLTQLVPPELRRVSSIEAFALLACCFGMLWGMFAALVLLPPALARRCSRWQRRRRRKTGREMAFAAKR